MNLTNKMRILFLADAQSSHAHKWVVGLSEKGFDIHLFSLHNPPVNWYGPEVKVYSLGLNENIKDLSERSPKKFIYFKAINKIKEIINQIKPDVLHSHYASSYGFLGSLVNFHPYVISVWGSDIESFPNKSFFHKLILKHALNRADHILSASHYLAAKSNEFIKKEINIIPFGVNIERFKPVDKNYSDNKGDIIIGTIKSLEKNYGIDILIRAFDIVKKNYPSLPLKLLIVGKGTKEKQLKELASTVLNPGDYLFQGYVDHDLISEYHNKIDIPVYLSRNESFGVSVIETMSCGKPVIVSNVGGLKEIINNGNNGILVPPNNIIEAAIAIEKLVTNSALRQSLGNNAREKVINCYNWNDNLKQMISFYNGLNNEPN
jgi:glycosyltransferase involved in cell wall biosynthesis